MKDQVISAGDPRLIGDVIEEHRLDAQQVVIDGDYIVIKDPVEYEIPLSDCSTPEKILRWVKHLSEKQWVTNSLLHRFIVVAQRHSGG